MSQDYIAYVCDGDRATYYHNGCTPARQSVTVAEMIEIAKNGIKEPK